MSYYHPQPCSRCVGLVGVPCASLCGESGGEGWAQSSPLRSQAAMFFEWAPLKDELWACDQPAAANNPTPGAERTWDATFFHFAGKNRDSIGSEGSGLDEDRNGAIRLLVSYPAPSFAKRPKGIVASPLRMTCVVPFPISSPLLLRRAGPGEASHLLSMSRTGKRELAPS